MRHFINHFTTLIFGLLLAFTAEPARGGEPVAFEGLIEPYELISVGTPVEGVVASVTVQKSTSVKKGEPLVYLESSVESAGVERARAMAAGQGELELEKERLAAARRALARAGELFAKQALSAEAKEQAETDVTIARARLQKAEENKLVARHDLDRARALLDQRTIKSPISGIVVDRFVSPGEFVDDKPLLKLAQLDPLRVEVVLPTEMFRKIKPGMKAEVRPESGGMESYSSTVDIVDKVIDPATGTFAVRLELPNPDSRLPSGLKCTVSFPGEVVTVSSPEDVNDRGGNRTSRILPQDPILTTSIR
jgi:RND family efflux transporter MFP subunit